ncbi:MAG: NAD(P)H-hydrate epimerase, partial [Chloroflexota bacterium]
MRLVTAAEMRELERRAFAGGVSEAQLMETAGTAVGHAAAEWLVSPQGCELLTLAGRGNNGGDALIATRVLWQHYGARPRICLVADRGDDPLLRWAREAGVPVVTFDAQHGGVLREWLAEAEVVLDGILGLGGRLPLRGAEADVLQVCREVAPAGQRRIAVDVPTGVQADTGQVDERAFDAGLTLATGPAKPGLFLHPGAARAGRVRALDIGLSPEDGDTRTWRAESVEVARLLPPRPDDSHKGTYGKLLVVAGSSRYVGAAHHAAAAAVGAGAGLVTLAVPAPVQQALAGRSAETTYLPLPDDPAAPGSFTPSHLEAILEAARGYDAVVLGPGIGSHPATQQLVLQLTARLAEDDASLPLLIDADGLNALAAAPEWRRPATATWVLTPHPGEMGRLMGTSTKEVLADRLSLARAAAGNWG